MQFSDWTILLQGGSMNLDLGKSKTVSNVVLCVAESFRYMRTMTEEVLLEEEWSAERPLVEKNYSNQIIVVEEHHEGTSQQLRVLFTIQLLPSAYKGLGKVMFSQVFVC